LKNENTGSDEMTKKIVIPGELVTEERKRIGTHVYLREGKIYSDCIGLVNTESNIASVVPLEGGYNPIEGDTIIGIVRSENFAGYDIDINTPQTSFILKKEMREMLKPKNIISAKVMEAETGDEVKIGMPRVFFGGEIIEITPVKIPRVIGREASMLNILRTGTGSTVIVGKNGRIWAKGGNTDLLKKAIKMIETQAHIDNLTDKITEFLEKNGGQKINAKQETNNEGEEK
jgi:exosome complex component RRP4